MVNLNRLGSLIGDLLDLILKHEVTLPMLEDYIAKTFPTEVERLSLGKREAQSQTEILDKSE